MSALPDLHRSPESFHQDRIILFGGSGRTLDLLRLATIRSDNVLLIAADIDQTTRHYVDRLAIEHRSEPEPADLASASTVLIAIGDLGRENEVVRTARRLGVPVHVAGRALLSDFSMLEFLERRSSTLKQRSSDRAGA